MFDHLNLEKAIIKEQNIRKEFEFNPKPLKPCKIMNSIQEKMEFRFIDGFNKSINGDVIFKKTWKHYKICPDCDSGIYSNYIKKETLKKLVNKLNEII